MKILGREFYTEAIFLDGNRADIVDADEGVIYEVVESEQPESILRKQKEYPLPIIVVRAQEPWTEKIIQ